MVCFRLDLLSQQRPPPRGRVRVLEAVSEQVIRECSVLVEMAAA